MNKGIKTLIWCGKIVFGCILFALSFDLFLEPNEVNAGGISGLAMVAVELLGFGSVGLITAVLNLPLFALGGAKIGRKFFVGSLIGMIASSAMLDLFAVLPAVKVEPLMAALYGGVLCGIGLGIVFAAGASTGGSDIIVRLLKLRYQNVPIGTINICFDLLVVSLTGLVFRDISRALYSGVTIFVCGQVIDAVVYRFDYSKVALIISGQYEQIARQIGVKLDRGATFLNGEGSYTGKQTKVVLTVVKKQQVAELKRLVVEIDPDAFIVVQEAHQVLGEGFARYSRDAL
ncbi:MAG: YitT family protein [Clostridiales bacterium]|nr:YitT family protein [Clostridiales bacterium]MDD7387964.1 YitT family protein [Bacillota bacterium]MDY6040847.1 YitT family protein [Candidatus Faecousia sp.]